MSVGVAQISASYQGSTGNATVAVGAPALVTITVSPNQSSMPVGETRQLTATGNFSDGSIQNLTQSATWISSGLAIASVNTQGVVTAAGVGAAQVSATSQGITGSASVTVAQPVLLTITISPNQSSLPLGESEPLTATGNFSDGSTRNLVQSVMWTSSLAAASVSVQGVVTGTSLGVAQVSAVSQGITGSASVTVGAAALLSITVSPNQYSLPAGESTQLTAMGNFSDGTTQNLTQSATWSSWSAIASVNGTGMVVANAAGEIHYHCERRIRDRVGERDRDSRSGSQPEHHSGSDIVGPGEQQPIPGDGEHERWNNSGHDRERRLEFGAASIASVTGYGYATAQQVGKTTIQAEINGITGSASLTVIPLMAVNYLISRTPRQTGFDATVELTNPGLTSGNLCAMVYVFNSKQVLNECCGCTISDSGMLTLSLGQRSYVEYADRKKTGRGSHRGRVVESSAEWTVQCRVAIAEWGDSGMGYECSALNRQRPGHRRIVFAGASEQHGSSCAIGRVQHDSAIGKRRGHLLMRNRRQLAGIPARSISQLVRQLDRIASHALSESAARPDSLRPVSPLTPRPRYLTQPGILNLS